MHFFKKKQKELHTVFFFTILGSECNVWSVRRETMSIYHDNADGMRFDVCDIDTIRKLLAGHGFHFSKSMGQNFLIDRGVPLRIAEMCGADEGSGVLEIGPGIGALTMCLAQCAGKVVSVELDTRLLPLLRETLSGFDNVEIVQGDILKTDICALVKDKFAGLRPAACANLPYNITTPALTALIEADVFESITVMIQREVARRICARAGTPDYGAFTVYAGYYTEPELLFDVPPDSFIPQPKVTSSVVKLVRRANPPVQTDEKLFFRIVRAAFAQRRKTLVNALAAVFPISKELLSDAVSACGYDVRIRGEALDLEGFAGITAAVGEMLK